MNATATTTKITKEFVEANKGKQFLIKFNKEIELAHKKSRVVKMDKIICSFFTTQSGIICYKPKGFKTSGFRLINAYYDNMNDHIESIEEYSPIVKTKEQIASSLAKKFTPTNHIDIQNNLRKFANGEIKYEELGYDLQNMIEVNNVRSLTSLVPKYVLEDVRKAFDNKTDYNWSNRTFGDKRHTARDYSISINNKDGLMYAYFSSEFANCLNGDYYILANPTTAIYLERD